MMEGVSRADPVMSSVKGLMSAQLNPWASCKTVLRELVGSGTWMLRVQAVTAGLVSSAFDGHCGAQRHTAHPGRRPSAASGAREAAALRSPVVAQVRSRIS